MKALVVEDDQLNRELLRRMLGRLQWESDAVCDGEAALVACRSFDYDVVLLDYEMPHLNGVATATGIRELDQARARHTRLIIVTGSDPKPLERTGLFDGLLPKPFVLDELRSRIESALARKP